MGRRRALGDEGAKALRAVAKVHERVAARVSNA